MAEASAATTIHVVPVMLVYRSGGACLRHARPHHLCCPLYVVSSAVALPKRLHRLWVTGRLWTNALSRQIGKHSRGDLLPLPAGNGLSSPWWGRPWLESLGNYIRQQNPYMRVLFVWY